MVSAVVVDLDGTLFSSGTTVSERSIAALEACSKAGVKIVVATVRPYLSVKHQLDIRLHEGSRWICSNGATIYEGDQCIYEDAMPADIAKEVISLLESSCQILSVSVLGWVGRSIAVVSAMVTSS